MTTELKNIWPGWELVEFIGEGSYGKVYKCEKRELNVVSRSAVKIMSIPKSTSETEALRSEGMDDNEIRNYYRSIVDECIREIRIMESMKGAPGIVAVEDFKIEPKSDGLGWNIYIRMELLKSLPTYMTGNSMQVNDIVNLGIDICDALIVCSKNNIIHRDIKPANILISEFGKFKLGDFGIARELERSTTALSYKGTFSYMAPEVYRGQNYDATVDIYSLGLVLYQLLNNNKQPFLDMSQSSYSTDRDAAREKRLRGETLPPPANASGYLAQVILKACSFKPENRFRTAEEFKEALIQTTRDNTPRPQNWDNQPVSASSPKKSVNPAFIIAPIILTVLILVVGIFGLSSYYNDDNRKLVSQLENGNFDYALELYDSMYPNGEEPDTKLLEKLVDRISTLKMDFHELNAETVFLELKTLEDMDIKQLNKTVEESRTYIAKEYAQSSYDMAKEYKDNEEYDDALELLSETISILGTYVGKLEKDNKLVKLESEVKKMVSTTTSAPTTKPTTLQQTTPSVQLPSPVAVSATTIGGEVLESSDVSSYRSFEASKVIDGYYDSCWCVNTKIAGAVGGGLKINFAEKSLLSGIGIVNGNQYLIEDGLYHKNGQVKNFTLTFSDGSTKSFTASFNSSGNNIEYFEFDTPVETGSVSLTVNSGHVGTKFGTNVCIGEIVVY